MQVGLPAEAGEHLAVGVIGGGLRGSQFPGDAVIVRHLGRVVEGQLEARGAVHHEYLGNFRVHRAHPGRVYQDQSLYVAAPHGSHFGGGPSAYGVPGQDVVLQSQFIGELENEVGDISDGVNPTGARGTKESGEGGRI